MVDLQAILVSRIEPKSEIEKEAVEFVRSELDEMRFESNEVELASPGVEEDLLKVAEKTVKGLAEFLKSKLVVFEDQPNKSETTKTLELKVQKIVQALDGVLNPSNERPNPNVSTASSFISENNKTKLDIKIPLSVSRNRTRDSIKSKVALLEDAGTQKDQIIKDFQKKVQSLEASISEFKKQSNTAKENIKEIVDLKQLNSDITEKYKSLMDQFNQLKEFNSEVQQKLDEQTKTGDGLQTLRIKNSELLEENQRIMSAYREEVDGRIKDIEDKSFVMSQLERSEKLRNELQHDFYLKEDLHSSNDFLRSELEVVKKWVHQ